LKRNLTRFLVAPLFAATLMTPAAPGYASDNDQTGITSAAKPDVNGNPKTALEVDESAGLSIPDPLTFQSIATDVDEAVTTSKPGHLLVTKSVDLSAFCTPTSGVIYFLIVDDVPIRNSALFSRSTVTAQISGVTTDVVAAGTHQIRVGESCTVPGATVTGSTVTLVGITSVIVLP
jgi:hypothetical protein